MFFGYYFFSDPNLKVSHETQQRSWRDSLRACQRCPRDCSGVLAVRFLEGAQGLLSHVVCVYLGYVTQVGAVVALAGCYDESTAQVLLFSYTPSG